MHPRRVVVKSAQNMSVDIVPTFKTCKKCSNAVSINFRLRIRLRLLCAGGLFGGRRILAVKNPRSPEQDESFMPIRLADNLPIPGSATVSVAPVGVSPTVVLPTNRIGMESLFHIRFTES
jgi:hypothetical protein